MLDVRKKFFTMRVVRQWHRSPRTGVAAPILRNTLKAHEAISNLL